MTVMPAAMPYRLKVAEQERTAYFWTASPGTVTEDILTRDYWQHVQWQRWASWRAFADKLPATARLWFIESGGPQLYTEVQFAADDYLVFGRETAGLPKSLVEQNRAHWLRIPMFNEQSRSLNLSNCAALVLFEALRQQGFVGGA